MRGYADRSGEGEKKEDRQRQEQSEIPCVYKIQDMHIQHIHFLFPNPLCHKASISVNHMRFGHAQGCLGFHMYFDFVCVWSPSPHTVCMQYFHLTLSSPGIGSSSSMNLKMNDIILFVKQPYLSWAQKLCVWSFTCSQVSSYYPKTCK